MGSTQPAKLKSYHYSNLEGAVVLITGASSGLGRELALMLCPLQLRLLITGRDKTRLDETVTMCNERGNSYILAIIADISYKNGVEHLMSAVMSAYHRLDLLILNAGINAHANFSYLKSTDVFEVLMRTNFYANVELTRLALPVLKKYHGRIVVINSFSGKFGLPSRSAYCASKFALTGFFESLRTEYPVPITMVYPTSLNTPMRSHNILKREGTDHLDNETRFDAKACARIILYKMNYDQSDIYIPFSGKVGVVLMPLFPRLMRYKLKNAAKL